MKIAFSWDDGALEDQKLFELHEKYEIPGMFFVPTKNREGRAVLTPEMMRKAESKYISFGGHTENHTYLTDIPLNIVESEVAMNKQYLEFELGHKINDFCLPGGRYNQQILKIVKEYYSTVRTADTMNFVYREGPLKPAFHFYPRGKKSLIGNAIRNHSYKQAGYVIAHYGMGYFELVDKFIGYESQKQNDIVMIWGHSWEIEKFGLWKELDNTMKLVKKFGCVNHSEMFHK